MRRERVRRKNDRGYGTLTGTELAGRSKLTTQTGFLPEVDRRSAWHRRFKDLIVAFYADLGGEDMLSEGQKALCRRAALLTVELEHREMRLALRHEQDEDVSPAKLDQYRAATETLRRLLETLGLSQGRKQRDVTPGAQRQRNTERLLRTIEGVAA